MQFLKQQLYFLLVSILTTLTMLDLFGGFPETFLTLHLAFCYLINYLFIGILFLITKRNGLSIIISLSVNLILNFINANKIKYLSTVLLPSDIFLFSESISASPALLIYAVILMSAIFLILFFIFLKFEKKQDKNIVNKNYYTIGATLFFFIFMNFNNNFKKSCESYNENWLCSFLKSVPNTRLDWRGHQFVAWFSGYVPFIFTKAIDDTYDLIHSKKVKQVEIEKIYNNFKEPANFPDNLPNIIVIMSEAHADARKFNNAIPLNISPNLDQHQISNFLSPSFGGQTANVEFEFLTSLNVSFNQDQLVYTSKINQPIYSLPYYLNKAGYETIAMHNAEKDFYNRHIVYPNMGFNKYISLYDMIHFNDRHRFFREKWANDILIYDNIKKIIHTPSEKPRFIFAVTVENHFEYNDDRFGPNNFNLDALNLTPESKQILNTYLSGVQSADNFVIDLIRSLELTNKPTILVFFGDHLPNLSTTYDELNFYSSPQEKIEKKDAKFYTTPLAVWSNFPLNHPALREEIIQSNFLAPKILQVTNVPLPPYYQFIDQLSTCYNRIHKIGNKQKSCNLNSEKILKDYEKINKDIINGKNFTFKTLGQ